MEFADGFEAVREGFYVVEKVGYVGVDLLGVAPFLGFVSRTDRGQVDGHWLVSLSLCSFLMCVSRIRRAVSGNVCARSHGQCGRLIVYNEVIG